MTARRLSADEAQAWGRVMASVRPLRAVAVPIATSTHPHPSALRASSLSQREREGTAKPRKGEGDNKPIARTNTLDGSWDKRLSRGLVAPDSIVDLHGHTLANAHAALDHGIDRALGRGDRLLLLVTGKPPRPDSERPHARGAIRAAVVDWLAASRHADAIAAVRGAHPRHGGQGALYLVLRRPRGR